MEILKSICQYAEKRNLRFLLIGGHAVNFYGLSRQTGDIDLLVPLKDKGAWLEILTQLKYITGQNDDRFARFRPEQIAAWPIDLMFVNESTFEKLFKDSRLDSIGAADKVRIASERNLIALKLHALKHFQEHRFAKDYQDLLGLLRRGKHGLSREEFKELCVRYASLELFDRILAEAPSLWH